MKKKVLCIVVLVALATSAVFALTACNKDVYTPPEGGEWVSRAVFIAEIVGVGELRFKNDTEWEMEMIDGWAVGESENTVWCQGTYYFENKPGTSPLHIVIDPSKGDPSNVKLAGDDNKLVDNGNEVVYQPDESGTYVVKINCIAGEVSAGGATTDQATMKFQFKPPQDGTPAGVAA